MERLIVISPAWAQTGVINLGLDFGTHSTKAILRVRNAPNNALVLFLDEPGPNHPAFAAPSLVRLCDGQLFFGQRAAQSVGGKLFNSLKVSLLPPPPLKAWDQSEFPQGTTPDLLVAIYLSWILGKIKTAVGKERTSRLSLNVAAPMNHVEDQALKERYLHVVNAAWQAAFESAAPPVTQGADLVRLCPVFKEFLDLPVPALEHRRFEVLPETLAPLVSLSRDPITQTGLYMMVDMGAGSTELSVSRVSLQDEEGAIVCYSDESFPFGGDQFSNNDKQNAGRKEAHTLAEGGLKDKLIEKLRSVWHSGFCKEKDGRKSTKHSWKQLTVVLAGGGMRRQGVQEVIEANPLPKRIFLRDPIDYAVSWHSPTGLDFGRGHAGSRPRDPLDSPAYLAVAHGLSLERQKWPEFCYPRQVEVLSSEPIAANPYERSYSQEDVG
ncbi:MAG TPA: hypothetical protein DDY78_24740 [Planctomycetales bacterium]|jgi:hypothetical protein|nr:hypothetical protein [Planctomycetales bacterium]